MTTHKGFKQLVRARMTKTGERYASARRALDADGGVGEAGHGAPATRMYPETASLARVLADRAVVSAATGAPLSEAMILGVGGGLGAGYILWEFKARGGAILTLGFSNRWQYPGMSGWHGKTLARLGIEADEHETSGAKGARETLDGILAEGRSVVAFVDTQEIGTWGQPDPLSGYSGYEVAIVRRHADGYLVDDRGAVPLTRSTRRRWPQRAVASHPGSTASSTPGSGPTPSLSRRCARRWRRVSPTRSATSASALTRSPCPPGASGPDS
jgi:hypothetical protein